MTNQIKVTRVTRKEVTINLPFPISDCAARQIQEILEKEQNSSLIYKNIYKAIDRLDDSWDKKIYKNYILHRI